MPSERLIELLAEAIEDGDIELGDLIGKTRVQARRPEAAKALSLKQTAKFRVKAGEKYYPRHPKDPMSRAQAGAIYGLCGGKDAGAPWLTAKDSGLTVIVAGGVINALKEGHPVKLNDVVTLTPVE
jgi:hypothetical protein